MCSSQLAILFAICVASVLAIESRVFGGYPLRYEVHKYLVKLSLQPQYSSCSGSIIDNSWIITAAHCFDKNTEVVIVYHQMQNCEQVIAKANKGNFFLHPEYVSNSEEDIALIKTSSPIIFSDHVQPIKLATSFPRVGQAAIIAGYGDSGLMREMPTEGAVKIFFCSAPGLICSENTARAGSGDSGGALISRGRLIGVTTASCTNAPVKNPCLTLYVDVVYNMKWIQEIVSSQK